MYSTLKKKKIKMSLKKVIQNKKRNEKRFSWQGVEVIIKDPITNSEVSMKDVLGDIQTKIPRNFLTNVDVIYVGDFEFLNDRSVQAMYENSCIFVTNNQSDVEDMCDDIVHEIAHSLEEVHREMIYADGSLEKEFTEKRKQLCMILKSEGFEADLSSFMKPTYDRGFDDYLYKSIGYPALNMLSANVFYSPYAVTSLREYFANGFEAYYYYRDHDFLQKSCPTLYKKLYSLMEDRYDREHY